MRDDPRLWLAERHYAARHWAAARPPRGAGWPRPAPSLTDGGFDSLDPARAKAPFQGRRVLTIAPRLFSTHPARLHEPIDNLMLSALRFGLDYRDIDTFAFGTD